jgi:hypothetical protein
MNIQIAIFVVVEEVKRNDLSKNNLNVTGKNRLCGVVCGDY